MDLRDKMYHDGLVVMHIDGPTNSVDVGTKNDRTEKALVVLTRKIVQGLYHPCGSKNFEKTFGAMQTNVDYTAYSSELLDAFEVWPVLMRLTPFFSQPRHSRGG